MDAWNQVRSLPNLVNPRTRHQLIFGAHAGTHTHTYTYVYIHTKIFTYKHTRMGTLKGTCPDMHTPIQMHSYTLTCA